MGRRTQCLAFYEALTGYLVRLVGERVRLDKRDDSGDSKRDYLLAAWREGDSWPEELSEPRIPPQGARVWQWFWQLNGRRSYGYACANPISFSELAAFVAAYGFTPSQWDITTLTEMDTAYLNASSEKNDAIDGDPQENAAALVDSLRAMQGRQ